MSTARQITIKDPPEFCVFCKEKRIGIQEGLVVFKCGSTMQYSNDIKVGQVIPTKRSHECQLHTKKLPG